MASTHIVRRRSVPFSGRRPQRRKLVWATFSLQGSNTLATLAKVQHDLLGNLKVAGASILGSTVMRTHLIVASSEPSADTNQGLMLGLIVKDWNAATIPDPSVDLGDDWMLHTVHTPTVAQQTYFIGTNMIWGSRYDVRAKRKVEELNEGFFLCLQNQGSGTNTYTVFCKTLLALP